MGEFKKDLKNDVVYYLHINNSNSSLKEIMNACIIEYGETKILEAKAYLLEECSLMIKDINKDLASDVSTVRYNTCNRGKQEVVIDDIIKIINCLEGSECDIEFSPVNPGAIKKIIPESFNVKAILDKLEAAHNDIKTLKDINDKLNSDINDLRSEINALKNRYVSPHNKPPAAVRSPLHSPRPRCPPPPPPGTPIPSHSTVTSSPSSSRTPQHLPTAPPALLVGITEVSDEETEDENNGSNNANIPNGINRRKIKLTAKQKYERNMVYMNSALAATVEATTNGENPQTAIEIGKKIGAKNATSWADLARTNNSLTANYSVNYPALSHGRNNPINVNKKVKKSRLAQVKPFVSGSATQIPQGISIVSQKPNYLNNKCLVIRGFDKAILDNKEQFQLYINKIAGKHINILFDKPISKSYSTWLTIVLELSVEDFDILNNPSLWTNGLSIREFVGWRWWRSEKPKRLTTNDIRNSMRDQWKCS